PTPSSPEGARSWWRAPPWPLRARALRRCASAPCTDSCGSLQGDGSFLHEEQFHVGFPRARNVLGLRGGDHRLAARADQLDEAFAPGGVELRHHVVEKHQWGAIQIGQHLALGEQQGEEAGALLTLRPVGAEGTAVTSEGDVVTVRAVPREAAGQIVIAALDELGPEPFDVLGARAGPVLKRTSAG